MALHRQPRGRLTRLASRPLVSAFPRRRNIDFTSHPRSKPSYTTAAVEHGCSFLSPDSLHSNRSALENPELANFNAHVLSASSNTWTHTTRLRIRRAFNPSTGQQHLTANPVYWILFRIVLARLSMWLRHSPDSGAGRRAPQNVQHSSGNAFLGDLSQPGGYHVMLGV
jgi:hypothetical protein